MTPTSPGPEAAERRPGFRCTWRRAALAALAAMLALWLPTATYRTLKQRAAVAGIHRLGGEVDYDPREGYPPPHALIDFFTNVQSVYFFGGRCSDVELEHLRSYLTDLPHLRCLHLVSTGITDEGLKYIEGLAGLRELGLSDNCITDAGLQHLRGLTGLEVLKLDGTRVTDAGLAELEALPRLSYLCLRGCKITDRGLEHVGRLTELEVLGLEGTNITDKGLLCLQGLSGLDLVRLDDTRITGEGVRQLRLRLPGVRTMRDGDDHWDTR
jgi:hypothetical protein